MIFMYCCFCCHCNRGTDTQITTDRHRADSLCFTQGLGQRNIAEDETREELANHIHAESIRYRTDDSSCASEVTTLWRYTNLFIIIIIIIKF